MYAGEAPILTIDAQAANPECDSAPKFYTKVQKRDNAAAYEMNLANKAYSHQLKRAVFVHQLEPLLVPHQKDL